MSEQLTCGNAVDLLAGLADESVDLTVTSPPYDDLRVYSGSKGFCQKTFETMAGELYRVTKNGGVVVWVANDKMDKCSETGTSFKQASHFKEINFCLHDTMIYAKANPMPRPGQPRYTQQFEYMFVLSKGEPKTFNPIKEPCAWAGVKSTGKYFEQPDTAVPFRASLESPKRKGREDRQVIADEKVKGNIWHYFVGNNTSEKKKMQAVLDKLGLKTQTRYHPAVMSIQLARDHVRSWSNEGDVVLDPMCGSGTTLVAAKELGRSYIGFDVSQEYVDIAKERLAVAQRIAIDEAEERAQWIDRRISALEAELGRLRKMKKSYKKAV